MSQINYSRYKYTPDEMNEKDFLARFVVREEIFDELFHEIKNANFDITNQHYIIIGQRGQGKTTLLRKLQLEVQNDKELSKFLLPIKFTEEQYQIRSLCRLWEEVADYLQTIYEDEFEHILDDMEVHFEEDDYDLRCFSYLERVLKSKNKKLLLLIDNIDELLGKLKEKEQKQLREILLTSSSFIIVGGSTKMFEQQYEYGKPFFEFFKIIKLKGLNREESIQLLRVIGNDEQKKRIEKVIQETPQRIETLRRLTAGVPRTIIMLFDIFTDEDGNAFEDLLKVLDDVTPLYKHRMDDLPPPLQDIVHTIALNWDGMFTKEIAKKTRLTSKEVSAQLKQLEKYQLIEAEFSGKNKIYKIQERFFNIWYLMRFGRKKDRNKVEWLVKFLLSWFSHSELESRANKFISALKNGKMRESYACYMCEALSNTGVLELETEYNMKEDTKKYLNTIHSKLANELSQSDIEVTEEALKLYKNGNKDDALRLLISSKKSSKHIFASIGILYQEQNKYQKSEEYYMKAMESGENGILMNFGILYQEQKKYQKAEEVYLKAVESGNNGALNNLGILYQEQNKYQKAEEYYLKAIENGNNNALYNLSWFYFEQAVKSDEALALAQKSYTNEQNFYSTYALSTVLLWREEFSKSYEKFLEWLEYDDALETDDDALEMEDDVIMYLNLLLSKGQFYKAKEFFEMEKYQLKERYKPIWYALMELLEKEFPDEIKKMGSELSESVDEILLEIERLKIKYAI